MSDPFGSPNKSVSRQRSRQNLALPLPALPSARSLSSITRSPSPPPSGPLTMTGGSLKHHLASLVDQKANQLQMIGQLGSEILRQQQELNERMRDLDEDREDELDEGTKRALRDLELSVGRWEKDNEDTLREIGGKPAMINDEPEPNDTQTSTLTRRQRNVQHRALGMEFATEIGQNLLAEVRRMQTLLSERDKALERLNEEKDSWDAERGVLMASVRAAESSVDRYKEENWNLEVNLQEIRNTYSETTEQLQKINHEQGRLTKSLVSSRELAEMYKTDAEKHAQMLEDLRQRHETEMAQARRATAGLQRERSDLLTELNGERQRAISGVRARASRGGSGSPAVYVNGKEQENEDDEDVFGGGHLSPRKRPGFDANDQALSPSQLYESDFGTPDPTPSKSDKGYNRSPLGEMYVNEIDELRTNLEQAQAEIDRLKSGKGVPSADEFGVQTPGGDSEDGEGDFGPVSGRGRGSMRGRRGRGRAIAASLSRKFGFNRTPSNLSNVGDRSLDSNSSGTPDLLRTRAIGQMDSPSSSSPHSEHDLRQMDSLDSLHLAHNGALSDELALGMALHSDLPPMSDDIAGFMSTQPTEFTISELTTPRLSHFPADVQDMPASPSAGERTPTKSHAQLPPSRMYETMTRSSSLEDGLTTDTDDADFTDARESVGTLTPSVSHADLTDAYATGQEWHTAAESSAGESSDEDDGNRTRTFSGPAGALAAGAAGAAGGSWMARRMASRETITQPRVVEVERIVERIVEVPVDRFVEVPVDRIVEKIVEVPVDRIVEVPVEKIVEKIVEVEVEKIVEVEKRVEVPVEVIREVERIVEVEKRVEVPVPFEVIKEVEVIREVEVIKEVEKRVEVPVEVIREVERIVEVEKRVEVPFEVIVEKRVEVPVEVERIVEREVFVDKIVERIVEVEKIVNVEVPVDRIVEKIVHVNVEVEKRVEVPVDRIVEVEKHVEVPVDRIVEFEKIVERIVEVPKIEIQERIVEVEKIVEVPVEVVRTVEVEKLVDRIVYVDRDVERIVEVEKPVEKIVHIDREVERVVDRHVEVPVERIVEVEKRVEVPVPFEVIREVEKIVEVEKRVEVPVEVIREVERIVEVEKRVEVPVEAIREIEKIVEVEKRVEVPVEVIREVERIVEVEKRVEVPVPFEVIREVEKIVEVEKRVEIPVEVNVEKSVEVPVEIIREVEKIVEVEKRVEVPVPFEVIKEVEKIIEVEKRVEVPVPFEVIKEVERIVEVEKRVEVPVEVIREVERIVEVEKRVEVPVPFEVIREVEKLVEVEKRVEVPFEVERIVERIVEVPVDRIVEIPIGRIVERIVEVPVDRIVERVVTITAPAPRSASNDSSSQTDNIPALGPSLISPPADLGMFRINPGSNYDFLKAPPSPSSTSIATAKNRRVSTETFGRAAPETEVAVSGLPGTRSAASAYIDGLPSTLTSPDLTRPPTMNLPPPPSAPPPAGVAKHMATSPSSAPPARPQSPPPSDFTRTTTTKKRLSRPPPTAAGSAMRASDMGPPTSVSRQTSTSSFRHPEPSTPKGDPVAWIKSRESVKKHATKVISSQSGSGYHSATSSFSEAMNGRDPSVSSVESAIPPPGKAGKGAMGSTDPAVIHAITQTMIGEYLWKYTRRTIGRGQSGNRHQRYFWIHPYTKTLYWGEEDPGSSVASESKAKSVYISSIKVIDDNNPLPPGLYNKSIIVATPGREIQFTAPNKDRHDLWLSALQFLLQQQNGVSPNGELAQNTVRQTSTPRQPLGPVDEQGRLTSAAPKTPSASMPKSPMSMRSFRSDNRSLNSNTPKAVRSASTMSHRPPSTLGKRSGTAAYDYWERYTARHAVPETYHGGHRFKGDYKAKGGDDFDVVEPQEGEDQDESFEGMDNVRACCDGKHLVGDHKHHHSNRSQTPASQTPSVRAWSMASRRKSAASGKPTAASLFGMRRDGDADGSSINASVRTDRSRSAMGFREGTATPTPTMR